jgi:hypothetical protein
MSEGIQKRKKTSEVKSISIIALRSAKLAIFAIRQEEHTEDGFIGLIHPNMCSSVEYANGLASNLPYGIMILMLLLRNSGMHSAMRHQYEER